MFQNNYYFCVAIEWGQTIVRNGESHLKKGGVKPPFFVSAYQSAKVFLRCAD